jgi:hypothetical protein
MLANPTLLYRGKKRAMRPAGLRVGVEIPRILQVNSPTLAEFSYSEQILLLTVDPPWGNMSHFKFDGNK